MPIHRMDRKRVPIPSSPKPIREREHPLQPAGKIKTESHYEGAEKNPLLWSRTLIAIPVGPASGTGVKLPDETWEPLSQEQWETLWNPNSGTFQKILKIKPITVEKIGDLFAEKPPFYNLSLDDKTIAQILGETQTLTKEQASFLLTYFKTTLGRAAIAPPKKNSTAILITTQNLVIVGKKIKGEINWIQALLSLNREMVDGKTIVIPNDVFKDFLDRVEELKLVAHKNYRNVATAMMNADKTGLSIEKNIFNARLVFLTGISDIKQVQSEFLERKNIRFGETDSDHAKAQTLAIHMKNALKLWFKNSTIPTNASAPLVEAKGTEQEKAAENKIAKHLELGTSESKAIEDAIAATVLKTNEQQLIQNIERELKTLEKQFAQAKQNSQVRKNIAERIFHLRREIAALKKEPMLEIPPTLQAMMDAVRPSPAREETDTKAFAVATRGLAPKLSREDTPASPSAEEGRQSGDRSLENRAPPTAIAQSETEELPASNANNASEVLIFEPLDLTDPDSTSSADETTAHTLPENTAVSESAVGEISPQALPNTPSKASPETEKTFSKISDYISGALDSVSSIARYFSGKIGGGSLQGSVTKIVPPRVGGTGSQRYAPEDIPDFQRSANRSERQTSESGYEGEILNLGVGAFPWAGVENKSRGISVALELDLAKKFPNKINLGAAYDLRRAFDLSSFDLSGHLFGDLSEGMDFSNAGICAGYGFVQACVDYHQFATQKDKTDWGVLETRRDGWLFSVGLFKN